MKKTFLIFLLAVCAAFVNAQNIATIKANANRGDAEAQFKLCEMYYMGEGGLEVNKKLALEWGKKSAAKGNKDAIFAVATIIMADYKDSTPSAEYHNWMLKAAAVDTLFQIVVAENYLVGRDGAQKNTAEALKWYGKAVDGGSIRCAKFLANDYLDDGGYFKRNVNEAEGWLKRASALGDAESQMILGIIYEEGLLGQRDSEQSITYMRKAALQGYQKSYYLLGCYLTHNQPTKESYIEAEKWLKLASANGEHMAEKLVGDICYFGRNGNENKYEAFKWYKKAADNNSKAAAFMVGIMYANGEGTSANGDLALKYIKKSKELGCPEAAELMEKATAEAKRQLAAEEQARREAAERKANKVTAWLNVFSALGQFANNLAAAVGNTSYEKPHTRFTSYQSSSYSTQYKFVKNVVALKCANVNCKFADAKKETVSVYEKGGEYYIKVYGRHNVLHNNFGTPTHSFAKKFRYWAMDVQSTAVTNWYYLDI